jgi:hypothetical protein
MSRVYRKTGKYSICKPTSDVSTITDPVDIECKNTGYSKQQKIDIMRRPVNPRTEQGYYMGVKNS